MIDETKESRISRRTLLGQVGKAAASSVLLAPLLQAAVSTEADAALPPGEAAPVNGIAGVDRVVVLPGKTYLRGWAGYGEPPRPGPRRPTSADSAAPPPPTGPTPTVRWSMRSGPGRVSFVNASA